MLQAIEKAVRTASEYMLTFSDPKVYEKDGHSNYVTQADLAVQQKLFTLLEPICENAMFFAEEQENACLTDDPTWVIDPIDGTHNFMRGRLHSAISVALLINKQPVYAVVANPYRDEYYTAEKGKGAFLNGEPIHVSNEPFEKALVSFGSSPYYADLAAYGVKAVGRFLQEAADIRRVGSAALDLTDVACGRSDIFFEYRLSPWDVAAGALLVTEAGGEFVMPTLDAPDFSAPNTILAANPRCLARAKEIVLSCMQ